ncbi:MAG: HEAT repeat domain-containing protein [Vicinamibacterales bacterium]
MNPIPAHRPRASWLLALLLPILVTTGVRTQERGPTALGPEALREAIDHLGDLDYPTRMAAARAIRRGTPAQVVPALVDAANTHADGYIRFRALVLLTGFPDPRTEDLMVESLSSDNDRMREVAYAWFEHHPSPRMVPRLLAKLETETGEFVRPSLVRALAASGGDDPAVREALTRDVSRGMDYFRSTVIEALGDYRRTWAVPALLEVARLDGPLQDDAAIALGKIGDQRALATLAGLQRTAPQETQPAVAAAICLLGTNCESHVGYLDRILRFAEDNPGYQPLLRGAASGLAAIAAYSGRDDAINPLLEIGIPSQDPLRAPIALGLGEVALRNPERLLATLEAYPDQAGAIGLVAEAFDMLEEDLDEERFFAFVRRTYWAAPEGSPRRALCEQLITRLDF